MAKEEARRARLESSALRRHAARTEEEKEIVQRWENRRRRAENYQWIINRASRIKKLDVQRLPRQLSENEIIARIAGGDKTSGSCSSLALAYAANRAGFDVLDFRGGKSQELFSSFDIIEKLAGAGGYVTSGFNGFNTAKRMLKLVEFGKEYYFTAGSHVAIVRAAVNGLGYEYLELQDLWQNGFKPLTEDELQSRFGVQKDYLDEDSGLPYKMPEAIIEIKELTDTPKFKELISLVNTVSAKQKKGINGSKK